jgi:RHS repeat-associated protein
MKKIFLFLTAALCLSIGNRTIGQTIDQGTTGSCTWTLTGYSPNCTLTISGNGSMGSYNPNLFSFAPWYSYRNDITTLSIQQGVTSVGNSAFYYCSAITSAAIPNSVTSIGNSAFQYCSSLASMYVKAPTPPALGTTVFASVSPIIPVYVPCGSETAYQSASGWSSFSNIIGDSCETDCTFPDLISSSIFYESTCYLYNKTVVSGLGVEGNIEATGNLKREHLAKIAFRGLYALNNNTVTIPSFIPSDNYASVFSDLNMPNAQNTYYYQAAKALSYLEYGDGITPFDYNNSYFYPQKTVARVDVLKVLLETFNIKPQSDNTTYSNADITTLQNNNPFKFGYVYKAKQLDIIDDINNFRPFDTCLRGEAFLMLYRIMTKIEAGEVANPNVSEADYFEPLNVTVANLAMELSPELGNFNHYAKSGFLIDGVMPLDFAITYNSYNAELPNEFFGWWTSPSKQFYDVLYQPLGPGWSHTYHSFITLVDNNTKLNVHWGGGTIHVYHVGSNGFECDNYGVYDELTVSGNAITIKTQSQVEYSFSKLPNSAVDGVLKLSQIKDRNNNTLTINYELGQDSIERISSVSCLNRSLEFSYKSGTNLLWKVSDPLNREITFAYSASPFAHAGYMLTQYKDAKNQTTTFTYGDNNHAKKSKLLLKIQLPKGNYIENNYDNNRRLIHSETGFNGVAKSVVDYPARNMNYNTASNPITVNALYNNKPFSCELNRNNRMTKLTGTQNLSVTANYNNATNPVLPTSLSANSTDIQNIQYDSKGNVTQVVVKEKGGSATRTVSFTYNSRNDVTTITDPKGNVTTYNYNGSGNLISINAPEGATTTISVNAQGLPTSVTNPSNIVTDYEYNSYGNLWKTKIPALNNITSTVNYDAASRVTSMIDFLNRTMSFAYDNNDNLLSETNANNHTTTYAYDANDNLTTITNAKGNSTALTYDYITDWLTSTAFGGATKSYEYNDDGTLKKFTKPDGTQLSSTYDSLGRITYDGVNSYEYDNNLRLYKITKGGKTLQYTYDGFNQITGITYDNQTVNYTYDNNGNVLTIVYPGNKTVTYTYDNLNRMKTVKDWNNRTITYNYLPDSRMQSVSYPNGMTATYAYDNAGRQTGKTIKRSDNTVITSYSFTLDNVGNIITENRTEPYTDISLPNENVSYAYNNANRITQAGNTSFTFDANGNTKTRGNAGYSYDNLDKLISGSGFSFEYDGLGNIRSNGSKKYWIDITGMGNVIAETDMSNNPAAYYIYGAGGLEARILPNGTTEYYVSDYRGSVIAMVDASTSANIISKYQYDEFGYCTQYNEVGYPNPFRYVGKYGVMYFGDNLYYMRARFYDPSIGRFLSEDPIWSPNLYPYADNNPIMGIDPKGTNTLSDAWNKAKDYVGKQVFDKAMDAIGQGLYNVIGNKGTDFLSEVGSGYYYGTKWVEESMNMYYEKYEQSVIDGNPDNVALVGYAITSMWTSDTYLSTAYTLASFGQVANAIASNATNISTQILGKTKGLGLVDMRTTLGRTIKAAVNAYKAFKSTTAGVIAFDASMKSGNYYDALKSIFNNIK